MQTFSLHYYAAHLMGTVSRDLANGVSRGFRWCECDPAGPLVRWLNRSGVIRLRYGRNEAST